MTTLPHLVSSFVLAATWLLGRWNGVAAGPAHAVAAGLLLTTLLLVVSEVIPAPAPFDAQLARGAADRLQSGDA
jgi:hypothetical protein